MIQKCLEENRGVIYTAPVKALSNQKFREFESLFPGYVGIVTGDVSIKPFSPLIIMTTEIFRNRILENPSGLEHHDWIIFDEIHYLDDVERGTVWEESLIFLPEHMKVVGLSATIPNIDQFCQWLKGIHPFPIEVIKETSRPVPLHFMFQCRGKIFDELKTVKKIAYSRRKVIYYGNDEINLGKQYHKNRPTSLIKHLHRSNRLPCIYFSFSRKRCEYLAERALKFDFLTNEERENSVNIFDDLCQRYNVDGEWRTQILKKLIERGIAYHHAGIHPMLKEVIEQLFTGKLIKIIFTTETFALGINMPAKTVVIDELRKKYGRFFRTLKVRDFFQMAGRGGRRGIDREGFVYSRIKPGEIKFHELKRFFEIKPEPIRSRFNVSYATILNLYDDYRENVLDVYSRSFHCFQEGNKSSSIQLKQMESKLKILKEMGYIRNKELTEKGVFAKNIYGFELPFTELFSRGIFESISFEELGILCLAAVFEPRPNLNRMRRSKRVLSLKRTTDRIIRTVHNVEKGYGINPLSKKFYFDLSMALLDWMQNRSFDKVIDELDMDEGEVIRFFRMSIQVLREMRETPVSESLRKKIKNAINLINRGVIDAEQQLKTIVSYE